MSQNKKRVPKLRFPEFSGEWEKDKLGDIVEVNPANDFIPIEFIYIDLDSVSQGTLTTQKIIRRIEAPSRAQRLVEYNDVMFQMVRPYQKNNILINFNLSKPIVASTGYAILRGSKCQEFIYHTINTSRFNKDVLERCTGTSYPAINSSDLREIVVHLPEMREQIKIADFFILLDDKIQTQEQIIENLEQLKKGYMQKIFSQELRFKDENGEDFPEWEEVKIGEFLVERKQYAEKEQGYPHVTLAKDGIYDKGERYNRDFLVTSDDKLYKITKLNDICYNPANLKFGVICRNDYGKAIFSPIYVTLEVYNADPIFVGIYLQWSENLNKIRRYEEGTVYERQGVKPEDFINVRLPLPMSMKEQKLISTFLSTIELKIKTENQKLEKLNLLKSGYLQQMFI